jgi:hypothetical protein
MDDTLRRAQLTRLLDFRVDVETRHEIYHDDAILEFPQSGERFVGVANFKPWRAIYPATLRSEIRSIRGVGDVWVVESSISYDGGPWQFGVCIAQFRGDKVSRETIYISESWAAPEWRAKWRDRASQAG